MYEELARTVVRNALRVDSSDIVTITTWDHTIDVANAMVVECFRQGADAMMSLWTDEYYYGMLKELSEESLGVCSKICEMFTETETATINMFGPKNPEALKSLSNSKITSWFEAERRAHYPRNLERKIRNVTLPFALLTAERAKAYGFNLSSWKKSVDNALSQDLNKLKEKGHRYAEILNRAHTVRLTAPNGTDLTFELDRRPVHVDDGIIDTEDIERKSLDAQLPAGSILTTINEATGSGRVVFDRPLQSMGVTVEGIEWEFKDGKAKSMKAKKNAQVISKQFDAASGDKDRIGWLQIGLNPRAEYGYLMDNIVEGAVQIGMGDNEYVGGKNKSSFGMPGTLSKATLQIDGDTITKDGS